ncbi:unnamed protein product, partial [Ectocarpus sp. 8 AP-2014]
QDEVQLGLARHGSSFAFKEEVLGDRGDTAARRPTNPVFPPPSAMPPAPCRREGGGKPQRDGGNMGGRYQHQREGELYCHNNAGGNAPPPPKALPMLLPPSPHVCHPCRARGGGGGGCVDCFGGAFPGVEAARWAGGGAPLTPGSPLPLDGAGLSLSGSDERPRRRRHRGQRGRRGGATGAPGFVCHGNDSCCGGGGAPTTPSRQQYGHPAGVSNEYGEQRTAAGHQASHFELTTAAARARPGSPPQDVFRLPDHAFDRSFEFGGGGGGGRADDLSNGGGNPYYPAPQPAQSYGGGAYGSSAGWGKGRGSPLATPETLSNTPPLELSPLDGSSPTSASASFQGFGGDGAGGASDRSAQELWNPTQYRHPARPAPPFFGMRDAAGAPQQQLLRQQQQQEQLVMQMQRQRYELESIAALKQQIEQLQRAAEESNKSGGVALGQFGGGDPTRSRAPCVDVPDMSGPPPPPPPDRSN